MLSTDSDPTIYKMKKLTTAVMVALIALILLSAKKNREEKWLSGNWGDWRTVPSYPGIDFRVNKEPTTDIWWVELKNGYRRRIHVSVCGCDAGDHCRVGDRLELGPGEVSDDWYAIPNASVIHVVIDYLKWDDD
jgi:hypothetical protein